VALEDDDKRFETPRPSDVLAKTHAFESILEAVVRAPVPVFADVCVVTAYNAAGRPVTRAAGDWDDPFMLSLLHEICAYQGHFWTPLPVWKRRPSAAQAQLIPVVDDTWMQANFADARAYALCVSIAPRSAIFVPLRARDELLGVILLWRTSTLRPYQETDLDFAEMVARRISVTIAPETA